MRYIEAIAAVSTGVIVDGAQVLSLPCPRCHELGVSFGLSIAIVLCAVPLYQAGHVCSLVTIAYQRHVLLPQIVPADVLARDRVLCVGARLLSNRSQVSIQTLQPNVTKQSCTYDSYGYTPFSDNIGADNCMWAGASLVQAGSGCTLRQSSIHWQRMVSTLITHHNFNCDEFCFMGTEITSSHNPACRESLDGLILQTTLRKARTHLHTARPDFARVSKSPFPGCTGRTRGEQLCSSNIPEAHAPLSVSAALRRTLCLDHMPQNHVIISNVNKIRYGGHRRTWCGEQVQLRPDLLVERSQDLS